MRRLLLALAITSLVGCGRSSSEGPGPDGASADGAAPGGDGGHAAGDASVLDAAAVDGSQAHDGGGKGPDGGGDASSGTGDGSADSTAPVDSGPDGNGASDAGSDGTSGPSDATTGSSDGAMLDGSGDAAVVDASGEAALTDASGDAATTDASGDAAPSDGGAVAACGDTRGLQPGAPWPMRGRCPTRMARADVAGPARANLKWSQRLGPSATDLVDYGSVVSSPVVAADGTIYVGVQGTGSVAGGLLAFGADGTPAWHYDTGHAEVASGAVVRADGSVVFASSDGNVVALETTGTLRWSTPLGAAAFASPLVGPDGTIYVGTQSGLTALHADGTVAWSSPGCTLGTGGASLQPDGSIRYNCGSTLPVLLSSGATGTGTLSATDEDQIIHAPPTIGPDGEVWFAGLTASGIGGISYFATLYSYAPSAGFQKRQFDWDSTAMFNSPALLPGGAAVCGIPYHVSGSQGAIVAAPLSGGYSAWASYGQRIVAQPSVDVDGNVYFVADTTLVSLGPTGSPRWTGGLDSNVQMGIAIGADGTLYIGTVNGWLYAYAP